MKNYRDYIRNNDIDSIKSLLKDGWDPSVDDNFAIKSACDKGHLEIVKLLLQDERVDPSAGGNSALRWASNYGYIKIVKLLLQDERVDPNAEFSCAIRWAIQNNHKEIVKLLMRDKRLILNTTIEDIKNYGFIKEAIKINREIKLEKLLKHERL